MPSFFLRTRRRRERNVRAAGEYMPARPPHKDAIRREHFGKYETFPRLRRAGIWAAALAAAAVFLWFALESARALPIFD